MTTDQIIVFWVLLPLTLIAIAIGGFVALLPLGIIATTAWTMFVIVVLGIILAESVYFLRPDAMILASILSRPYAVYSPLQRKGENPGWLGGIVIIFPPFLATGQLFPVTGFEVPFEHSGAVTDDVKEDKANGIERDPATPVKVFAGLMLKLPTELDDVREFVQSIPALRNYRNLCEETDMDYLEHIDAVTGKPLTKKRKVPRIAEIIRDTLGGTFGEALGRAIPGHSFSQALKNRVEIEESVELHMAGVEWNKEEKKWEIKDTIASDAGIFQPPPNFNLKDPKKPGPVTSKMRLHDFNIGGIIASNEKVTVALSYEQEAIRTAKGRAAEGKGEADLLRPVREQVALPGGREALASRTLREVQANNINIVASSDMLTAGIANLAIQQPAPQQPPPSPQAPGTP